jgi:hypothetical protein
MRWLARTRLFLVVALTSVSLVAPACGTANLESGAPGARTERVTVVTHSAGPTHDTPLRSATNARPTRTVAAPVIPAAPPVDPEAEARTRAEEARLALEAEWPLHGLAYHYLVQVRAAPDGTSRVVGYMRRGARFRSREALAGPGCGRGWNEVPGHGYVCRGEGVLVGAAPPTFDPLPVPPSLDDALPYAYARVARSDAPQFWRLPSADEERQAELVMGELRGRVERARAVLAASEASATAAAGPDAGTGVNAVSEAGVLDAESTSEPDVGLEAPPGSVAEGTPSLVAVEEAGVVLPAFFRMRLETGFYVSVDREEETVEGRRYFRTIRGAYVPSSAMTVAEPPAMRGVVLGGGYRLPLGFVWRRGATALTREPVSGTLRNAGELTYHEPLILEDQIIERRDSRYRVSRGGVVARETALRIVTPIERPRGVADDERWIHVDLSEQTLVAYEGDVPVFATLVSSGRERFETPTGTFRIESKHVSTTMDDPDSLNEAYSIEDVPWTMYFHGSYALHAAFWHDHFGRTRSHGCLNLAPADARWLFAWAGPELPPGWHGVISSPRRVGSVVHITD